MHIGSQVETLLIYGRRITAGDPLSREKILFDRTQAFWEYFDAFGAAEGDESVVMEVVKISVFAVVHSFFEVRADDLSEGGIRLVVDDVELDVGKGFLDSLTNSRLSIL